MSRGWPEVRDVLDAAIGLPKCPARERCTGLLARGDFHDCGLRPGHEGDHICGSAYCYREWPAGSPTLTEEEKTNE